MKNFSRKKKFLLFPVMGAAFLGLVSFVVMQLWNCLIPDILHLSTISFWQALGLFILCKLLFGFGGFGPRGRGRGNGFRDMDPEQRAIFKSRMKDKMCGWWENKPGQPHQAKEEAV